MRRVLLFLVALITGACGQDATSAPPASPEPPPDPEPHVPRAPAIEPPTARPFAFTTSDGVRIEGELRTRSDRGAPLVVLVHQLSSDRAEWAPLLERLASVPVDAYAMDMRGHGASTHQGDHEIHWDAFAPADWQPIGSDVREAIEALREDGLAPSHVVVIGSSIGSSAAIQATARDDVDAVVALSPGRAYHGVDALGPLANIGDRPLLAIAARGEPESAETAQQMAAIVPRGVERLVDGRQHGVSMFAEDPRLLDEIVSFVRANTLPDDGP
ncbi:MAG: alpha/beta hydrolase [Sandaracinaceae bacterium]